MALPRIKMTLQGVGWQRFQQRLRDNEIGARQMANTRFLIGTSLPYASHWIEEGWRDDPRYGRVRVAYRAADVGFLREAATTFKRELRQRRPSSGPLGVAFSATMMIKYADRIVQIMRRVLNQKVYSAPVPTRNGRRRYTRSHRLFNSIKAYRT